MHEKIAYATERVSEYAASGNTQPITDLWKQVLRKCNAAMKKFKIAAARKNGSRICFDRKVIVNNETV